MCARHSGVFLSWYSARVPVRARFRPSEISARDRMSLSRVRWRGDQPEVDRRPGTRHKLVALLQDGARPPLCRCKTAASRVVRSLRCADATGSCHVETEMKSLCPASTHVALPRIHRLHNYTLYHVQAYHVIGAIRAI